MGSSILDNRKKLVTSLSLKDLQRESQRSGWSGLGDRLNRYGRAMEIRTDLLKWLSANAEEFGVPSRVIKELAACGLWLLFRYFPASDQVRLARACSCRRWKLCPVCALRYSGRLLRILVSKLERRLEEYPGVLPYLVTETVRNGPDLSERYKHLREGLKTQHQRARYRKSLGKGRRTEFEAFLGVFRSIECKRGKGGMWHPHAHMLALCDRIPDQSQLSVEWGEITGDSFIVDARPFQCVTDGMTHENLMRDCLEVCKYVTKFGEAEPEDMWQVYTSLGRSHVHESYGIMIFSAEEREELENDRESDLDEPFIEYMARYGGSGKYELFERKEEISQKVQDWMAEGFLA